MSKTGSLLSSVTSLSLTLLLVLTVASSCVPSRRPVWSKVPDLVVFVGQSVVIKLQKYAFDPGGGELRFVMVAGPGCIEQDEYKITPSLSLLGDSLLKEFTVTIRAISDACGFSDTSFNLIVVKGAELTRSSDFHIRQSEVLRVDLTGLVQLETGMRFIKLSDVGRLSDNVFTYVGTRPVAEQIPILVQKNGLNVGLLVLNVYVHRAHLTVRVSEYRAGPAVAGARVEMFDARGIKLGEGETDENGKFETDLPVVRLRLTKSGYATTVVDLVGTFPPFEIETTLRKAKFSSIPSTPSVRFELRNENDEPLTPDGSGTYNLEAGKVRIVVNAFPTGFDVSHVYVKQGSPPGAEFLTSPRIYAEGSTLDAWLDLSTFVGFTPLFVDVYDDNDNHTLTVLSLNVAPRRGYFANFYLPEPASPFAIASLTLRQDVRYYSVPGQPIGGEVKAPEPLGAPDGMNLYVELAWRPWEESAQTLQSGRPIGFRVYRSLDGTSFLPIATLPSSVTRYRDGSVQLATGHRVWYAVSSVYTFGESPKVVLGSVVPLPMVYLTDVRPADGATSVATRPSFSWRFSGLEMYEGLVTYHYDLWLYDTVLGRRYYEAHRGESSKFSTPHPNVIHTFDDFTWKRPNGETIVELTPGRPYEWGLELLVAEWKDEENNSVSLSVNCDYNAKLLELNLPPERYFLFITKGDD